MALNVTGTPLGMIYQTYTSANFAAAVTGPSLLSKALDISQDATTLASFNNIASPASFATTVTTEALARKDATIYFAYLKKKK